MKRDFLHLLLLFTSVCFLYKQIYLIFFPLLLLLLITAEGPPGRMGLITVVCVVVSNSTDSPFANKRLGRGELAWYYIVNCIMQAFFVFFADDVPFKKN